MKETIYNIENNIDIKVGIISDIHFSDNLKNSKLNKLKKYILSNSFDYILIPGDIVDCVNEVKGESVRVRNFLSDISKSSKIIIGIGNHDITFVGEKKCVYNSNDVFFNELNSINNVYVLNNDYYEDDYVYICGLTLPHIYYKSENIDILNSVIKDNKKLLKGKKNKKNLLLIHSPYRVNKVLDKFDSFDYIISGHMHNGCVPPLLNKLWNSNRGIITPNKRLFGKYARGRYKNIIINGPITTFSKRSGIFRLFNFMFPMYITILNFKNSK